MVRMVNDPLTIIHGDALSSLQAMESESVQCVVTSPPYWGLRDYGHEWQIGLEKTPAEYVARLVEIFGEVNRVLRKDGTVWLNLGDSYAGSGCGWGGGSISEKGNQHEHVHGNGNARKSKDQTPPPGLKAKDLVGIPWRVAFALQSDGWYLRSDIIWSKPNPMPESVTDRPTKSHEYIFLLSKSERYHYNAEAISEPSIHAGEFRITTAKSFAGQAEVPGRTQSGNAVVGAMVNIKELRNKRSVWAIGTQSFPDAHFATFPTEIPRICILAGAPVGGVVLDPFAGSGTTGKVAIELGRKAILIEPKAEYIEMIKRRCQTTIGLPFSDTTEHRHEWSYNEPWRCYVCLKTPEEASAEFA